MMVKYTLAAIGNPVLDVIETPFVKTDSRVLSGCSTNAGLAVSKLGGESIIIGTIGRDFRKYAEQKLSEYNVKFLFYESRETGGFYLKYIDERMNDRILEVIGRADPIDIEKIPRDTLLGSRSILLGPILDEISVADSIKLIRELRSEGYDGVTLVDPQGYIRVLEERTVRRVNNPALFDLIGVVDVFKPNEHEAKTIFGTEDPVKAVKKMTELGAKIGIVTLAERGSVICFDDKVYGIPAYRTIEKDPTGCGDVYGGSFLYYYLKHNDPLEAAVFASAAASFMVESVGPDFNLDFKKVFQRFEALIDKIKRLE